MKIIKSKAEIQNISTTLLQSKKSIGFVPTMGYFHDGHLSLMKKAKKENDIVIISIFVNPLQFGPTEDYEEYPRDEEHDMTLAKQIGVDYLFKPDVEDIYPEEMMIKMSVTERTNVLCGRSRPGHFDGVITVLAKLFNIVQPTQVYFGMKDAQQVAIVDALISNLNFPIKLNALATIREDNGLAMSSRNVNLTMKEREQAIWLHKSLKRGQQLIVDGEKNPVIIKKEVINTLKQNIDADIDYVDILEFPSLQTISTISGQIIIAAAIYFKRTRLIDNLILDNDGLVLDRLD